MPAKTKIRIGGETGTTPSPNLPRFTGSGGAGGYCSLGANPWRSVFSVTTRGSTNCSR
jgi:hypothetical protein